jgi:hypothetical protein
VPVGGRIVGGGGGAAAVAWKEEVNADFTTLSTQQFDHDDTFTLGGATWLVEESDGGATRGIVEAVSGSGIKITPTGSGSDIYQRLNLPVVSTKLADVCAGFSDKDLICFQAFFDQAVTPADEFDGFGSVVYESTASGELEDVLGWFVYDKFYKGVNQTWKVGSGPGQGSEVVETGSTPTTIEIVYSFWGNYGTGAHSASAATSPAPFSTASQLGYATTYSGGAIQRNGTFTAPTRTLTAANARCGFGAFKVDSGTAFHVFLKRIRILRAAGDAGGLG